ncbi:Y-family DNA polymerase [Engelhardtia mirabilis]|uniref:UmuC domain-containing protein n=1 Tax=Engelhardtia mirabilis TaxID=2528011 RepID=A0A518BFX6_9BACT|nr:hypothetical protein Pla133_09470 [Planctomycetes bacterium Pla133]QDV00207.1 hypothetical protein Pla86_09460 [Planctomycetes bacterium Pla86]
MSVPKLTRWLAIHLPHWSVERVRRRLKSGRREGSPDLAILLVETVAERSLVARCCGVAGRCGVRPGMTVAGARALLAGTDCHVEAHEPEREAAALAALGRELWRFTPRVAARPPDGLLLDVAGCERLFGGERPLLEAAVGHVRAFGFGARAAVAGTAAAARAVARFGPQALAQVASGCERAALEPLPLEALDLAPRILAGLHELELANVGQCLDLSRAQLATRFGEPLLAAIDRALGARPETVEVLRYAPPPSVERELEGVTDDLETLLTCVRLLLDDLCAVLEAEDAGALALMVELFPTDAPPARELVALSHPSRDPAHLMALIEPQLERVRLGFGVDRLRVTAPRTSTLRPRQGTGFGLGADLVPAIDRALGELLDAYAGRFGPRATYLVEAVESHLPERAFRPRPVPLGSAPPRLVRASLGAGERPSAVLFRPEPVEVRTDPESGALLALRWRAEERALVRALGPERLAETWWTALEPVELEERRAPTRIDYTSLDAPTPPPRKPRVEPSRDYYRVQDSAGRWLWLFRAGTRWFVHGEWA